LQHQDDEKSLCASDLSGDFSLDNPSYGSIILQIQEANSEADGTCDFIWKAFEIIGNTRKFSRTSVLKLPLELTTGVN
jgi:hypothetical protein